MYQALLLVSFGGPESADDVMPFLENVVRGRPVPRQRLEAVAEHYRHFGGSPINQQNRDLIKAIQAEFARRGIALPVYFGNRNWAPYLKDSLLEMRDEGVTSALAFFTSMFSCYSGCRQYRENIEVARHEVGEHAPVIDKIRMGYNHPKFIAAVADRISSAVSKEAAQMPRVIFTAHSVPLSMAKHSTYELQLNESCRLVADKLGLHQWELAYQSRSGSPHTPWLEPDIGEVLERRMDEGERAFVVMPIGFTSDHIEVLWDLDEEAREICLNRGAIMYRAGSVGTHPLFVEMIADLVEERISNSNVRIACGDRGPSHDTCPPNCCLLGTELR